MLRDATVMLALTILLLTLQPPTCIPDHIFGYDSTNQDVYKYCHPIIEAVMQGFNGELLLPGIFTIHNVFCNSSSHMTLSPSTLLHNAGLSI